MGLCVLSRLTLGEHFTRQLDLSKETLSRHSHFQMDMHLYKLEPSMVKPCVQGTSPLVLMEAPGFSLTVLIALNNYNYLATCLIDNFNLSHTHFVFLPNCAFSPYLCSTPCSCTVDFHKSVTVIITQCEFCTVFEISSAKPLFQPCSCSKYTN